MSAFTKEKLSGSTNGKQTKVVATATPGTLIHTAVAGTTSWDEIWLYVTNNHTAVVELTIELGGVTSPDDLIKFNVPNKSGLIPILPGLILQNGLVVRAFANVANVLSVVGFVNRIAP